MFLPVSQCFSIAQSLLPLTPQRQAAHPKAQEISRLQKKQSFKANAGAAANAAENALKNEVQKVPG